MRAPKDNAAVNEWAPEWLKWIPEKEQQENFLNYGFYSLDLTNNAGDKLGKRMTKVISLNTNICYRMNWEAVSVFSDPGDMLNWL
jgi:sphingomyelin phosphodiesterase